MESRNFTGGDDNRRLGRLVVAGQQSVEFHKKMIYEDHTSW